MRNNESTSKETFEFTGSGGEYFKIWIVNILLSIVTLGIYSAWAKVRTQRYFYGNTYIAKNNFEYHANPLTILKGRIIAVAFFLLYSFSGHIYPPLAIIMAILLFILVPWAIVNALRFNARVSSYRGIHFNFNGTYGNAIMAFIVLPIVSVFTFFLLFPYALYKQAAFYIGGHQYGKTQFEFSAGPGPYYQAALVALFIILFGYLFAYFALGSGITSMMANPEQAPSPTLVFEMMLFFYGPIIVAFIVYRVFSYNILFNNLAVKSNQFSSDMKILPWCWIVLSNTVLILCTLGIFYPWAKVRSAKYRASVTRLNAEDLDSFIAGEQHDRNALGDEIGEVFDIGVGI